MPSTNKLCKTCKKLLRGRSDKIFCNASCKSAHHNIRRQTNKSITSHIDKILHRNRSILEELMGQEVQIQIHASKLEKLNFNFKYITNYYINKHGKTYHVIYDFAWMRFSSGIVLLVNNKPNKYLKR